ncbi:MAG: histone deacetylase family protein [Stagnimonas sp.]|nr:histone deacetylase family protein [Stagnimonas sp.]
MTYRPLAWISHPDCLRHEMGALHPESPLRLHAITDRLRISGVYDFLQQHEAPLATVEALLRVHGAAHVEQQFQLGAAGKTVALDADTVHGQHTLAAALRAAGAGVLGVDLVLDGKAGLAFCAVRPPGHHCERDRAMGFCFFNNIAVAAGHALARGLRRIAILDFDVHYGNGTADIFKNDDRVWLFSTYQDPLYPHWAGAPEARNLIDVPLPAYSDGKAFRQAVSEHWLPALQRLQPELILVSAGFDAHAQDPLADLRLGFEDFRWLGGVIGGVAESCCPGRVVASLEGGYEVHVLARSVEAFLLPFLGDELPA